MYVDILPKKKKNLIQYYVCVHVDRDSGYLASGTVPVHVRYLCVRGGKLAGSAKDNTHYSSTLKEMLYDLTFFLSSWSCLLMYYFVPYGTGTGQQCVTRGTTRALLLMLIPRVEGPGR